MYRTRKYVVLQGEIKIADEIMISNQSTLRYENYPGLSRWTACNHKSPLNVKKEGRRVSDVKLCNVRKGFSPQDTRRNPFF